MQKIIIFLFLSLFVLFVNCKNDEKVEFVVDGQINGTLKYNEIKTNTARDVPAGSSIRVANSNNKVSTFTTKQDGVYTYTSTIGDTYTFDISIEDSVLQFDKSLVDKGSIDTIRNDIYLSVDYSDSFSVTINQDNPLINKNVVLASENTGLRVLLTDSLGNPLPRVDVCLYNNKYFFEQNLSDCGGSIRYLRSDENGEVLFIGLKPVSYYVNARGQIGSVAIDNHFEGAIQETIALEEGGITSITVILE